MKTELREQPFDPWQEIHAYQETLPAMHGKFGATSVFVGSMRDFNVSDAVTSMFLEHYPEMTSRYLEIICNDAMQRWNILDVLTLHRVGKISPSDTIVLIAVWSAHREDAYSANRYILEELKHRAPFWKKETLTDNSERWVTNNTDARNN
jgi:molybdopterin synthase catalytic subunit